MTVQSQSPRLKLIEGGDAPRQIDLADLLENMDVRQALPRLREISRRRKAAANSSLAVVASGTGASVTAAQAPVCSPE